MRQASELRIAGDVIPRLESFKFLGIVLDSRLSMVKHIDHIKAKCSKRLNLFRCIAGTEYGADRKTLLYLYKALVLPIIEYGAVIYAGASDNTLKKLDTIQNSFLRIALGAMKTSPIPSLQVEAFIPPLHLRRMEQSLRYTNKILFQPNHSTFKSLHVLPSIHHNYIGPSEKRSGLTIASRIKKFSTDLNYLQPEIHPVCKLNTPPWMMRERQVIHLFDCPKTQISPQETQQRFLNLQNQLHNFYFIYTDGSKDGERTANAIYCTHDQHVTKTRLNNNTSIYIAELHAVYQALCLIQQQGMHRAVICTDSQSVVQSLQTENSSSSLLAHILNIHQELSNGDTQIVFLWVPGHSDIYGNERADRFAKEALSIPNITHLPVEYPSLKTSIRQAMTKHWQEQWTDLSQATQLRRIKPLVELWSSSTRNSRREEKVLARIRIGHTAYTHSYIYAKDPRPMCRSCNHPQSVEHFVIHCQNYQRQRKRMTDFCTRENLAFNLAHILGDSHPVLLDLLFLFLRDIQIFEKL